MEKGYLDFVTYKKVETRNVRLCGIQGWPEQLCRVYKGMFRGKELRTKKGGAGREGYKRADLV